ncbi:MAG TPA: OmpH family outer membrane protein [Acidobacteriaceae bacterium]|jgi:Skp family chaperone for outer membrane proteins|nr:OmpH family outer membrane protein [Acidobacteriaceae bacterium]
MNRSLLTLSTLVVALTAPAFAQTAAPTSLSPAPAPVAPAPVATPAKIALIAFQEAVFATNEGEAKMQDIQKKYEPTKATIETLGNEIDSLKKQLDAASATLSDDEKASRERTIDSKTKELQLDEDNAQQSYNADLASAFDALAKELYPVAQKYVADNGFTILINESQAPNELPLILWARDGQDVTKAVIDAYNANSGVSAPAPHPHPATHTAPKPAAPQQ